MAVETDSVVRRALAARGLERLQSALDAHRLLHLSSRDDIFPCEFIDALNESGADSLDIAELVMEIEAQLTALEQQPSATGEAAVQGVAGTTIVPKRIPSGAAQPDVDSLPFRKEQQKVQALLRKAEEAEAEVDGRAPDDVGEGDGPAGAAAAAKEPPAKPFLPRPTDEKRTENSFKVLCLHGDTANKSIADAQARMILDLPRAGAQVECLDGPLEATPFSTDHIDYGRAWACQPPWRPKFALEQCARLLAARCRKHGPYKIGYGFSQGAAALAYFCQPSVWRDRHKLAAPPFEALLLASATDAPLPPPEEWEVLTLPSYHILGQRDFQMSRSVAFLARFERPHYALHPFGHEVPLRLQGSPIFCGRIREFVHAPDRPPPRTADEAAAYMQATFEDVCEELKDVPDFSERLKQLSQLKMRGDL